MIKKILIVLVVLLVVIQFIHPARNANAKVTDKDITHVATAPDSVLTVLKRDCFDCHSNSTVYPWYSQLQPVDWWLTHHIHEGKEHLNFSEFGAYPAQKQVKKLTQIAKSVREGWMPLDSYLWIHKNAIMTDGEKILVANWAESTIRQLSAKPVQ